MCEINLAELVYKLNGSIFSKQYILALKIKLPAFNNQGKVYALLEHKQNKYLN